LTITAKAKKIGGNLENFCGEIRMGKHLQQSHLTRRPPDVFKTRNFENTQYFDKVSRGLKNGKSKWELEETYKDDLTRKEIEHAFSGISFDPNARN